MSRIYKKADALYVRFNNGKIAKTLRMNDRLIVDLDNKSNILGIELLNAKAQLAPAIAKEVMKESKNILPTFA